MATVTLRLYEPPERVHFIDGHNVSVRRLKGALQIGNYLKPVMQDCVIDTGAYLSVVPKDVWHEKMGNDIRWLAKEADPLLPWWLRNIKGIGGGTYKTRLGILAVRLIGGPGELLR